MSLINMKQMKKDLKTLAENVTQNSKEAVKRTITYYQGELSFDEVESVAAMLETQGMILIPEGMDPAELEQVTIDMQETLKAEIDEALRRSLNVSN